MEIGLARPQLLPMTIQMFVYLQVLDFLTTLVGFRVGLGEASPFIRLLVSFGPVWGLAVSKLVALGLGGLCVHLNRVKVISMINYWYAGLVIWNLSLITHVVMR
jgi:hypothetical protein